jgi:predicted DNA binding CopG/RHH family protein
MEPESYHWYWMEDIYRPGQPRTGEEFKQSWRNASLKGQRWTEMDLYASWAKEQKKDIRVSLRMSSTDVMKLKALARMKGTKFRTYMTDIRRTEIRAEEERLANDKTERQYRRAHGEEAET